MVWRHSWSLCDIFTHVLLWSSNWASNGWLLSIWQFMQRHCVTFFTFKWSPAIKSSHWELQVVLAFSSRTYMTIAPATSLTESNPMTFKDSFTLMGPSFSPGSRWTSWPRWSLTVWLWQWDRIAAGTDLPKSKCLLATCQLSSGSCLRILLVDFTKVLRPQLTMFTSLAACQCLEDILSSKRQIQTTTMPLTWTTSPFVVK